MIVKASSEPFIIAVQLGRDRISLFKASTEIKRIRKSASLRDVGYRKVGFYKQLTGNFKTQGNNILRGRRSRYFTKALQKKSFFDVRPSHQHIQTVFSERVFLYILQHLPDSLTVYWSLLDVQLAQNFTKQTLKRSLQNLKKTVLPLNLNKFNETIKTRLSSRVFLCGFSNFL